MKVRFKQFPRGIPPGNHVVRILSATEDVVELDYVGPEHGAEQDYPDRERYLIAHPRKETE